MAKQLLGKEVTAALNERIKGNVAALQEKGVNPTLCIIRVGENPSDISYEKGATKRCETLGVACEKILLPEDVAQDELLAVIDKVNKDNHIHGVLLFRPLPKHLDQAVIENALAPEKDVDCMTDLSMSGVFTGKKIGFPPCTPQACMEILDHYGIDCTGKKAVVIGRSLVVGKPNSSRSFVASGSSPKNGSSMIYKDASVMKAQTIITFCFIPFEKLAGNQSNLLSKRNFFNSFCAFGQVFV